MAWLTTIISLLYAASGFIIIIGYYPTIRDVFKKKKSANVPSYTIWTLTSLIGFLYATIVVKDLLLSIITGAGLFCCALILIMAMRIK